MLTQLRAFDFSPVREEAQIQLFIDCYGAYSTRTPAPPLGRDKFSAAPDLWAVFDAQGAMLGGFELLRGDEMTWMQMCNGAPTTLDAVPPADQLELNCVWLAPEMRRTWGSIRFWRGLAYCLERAPERHIVFAIDARKPALERFYRPIIAGQAYSGPFASERVPAGKICWTTPRHFRYLAYYYLSTYARRGWSSLLPRKTPRDAVA